MPLNKRGVQGRNPNQNMNNKGQTSGVQKIHLRRNVSKQQLIEQNLSHMQQAAQKKRDAQNYYYNQQANRSPLVRPNTSNYRAPVHNRLGSNKQANTMANTNRKPINRNEPGNRIKLRRTALPADQIIRNNIIRRRNNNNNNKMRHMQSVQNRLLKIRQNHQVPKQQMFQNNGQKIRLRRMRQGPVNYTVQVVNSGNKNKQHLPRHNKNLNPKLQEEIRLIQNKNINHEEVLPSVPIHPQGTGFTGTSLNERFSHLA